MKNIILLYAFTLFCSSIKGQNQFIFIDQPFQGLPARSCEVKEIDSLNLFPKRIQYIVRQLLDSAITDFTQNTKFIQGQISDLDEYYKNDSSFHKYEFLIPKYELYFELSDSALNIKRYCIAIALDQHGQILRFDWPRRDYNKREYFAANTELKKIAMKYAKQKHYKTSTCLYDLYFNEDNEVMELEFSFLQQSSGDEISHSEKYKCLTIDVKSKEITRNYEKISQSIACGGN